MRPHVDEVVLAADRNGDPDVLSACADLADRRLRFELRDSPAKLVGWIQHQCAADWILRLDDDEIPSRALLDALPDLMAERRLSEIAFPRRWLLGSTGRWIDCPPWRLEYQGRLLRNVPGLWTFEGRVHTVGATRGERRLVDMPLYHADLVLSPLEARRRKSLRYEAEDPGAMWDGFPVNAMYLPEEVDGLSTAEVPEADRALLDSVLSAPSPGRRPAVAGVRDVDLWEIDRFNVTSRPSESSLRGSVEWVAPPVALPAGTLVHHDVRVRNLGDALWRPRFQPPAFFVELRIRDESGDLHVEHSEPFTETIWPGQESILLLPVRTPTEPGEYMLELDLLHNDRRFGDGPRIPLVAYPPRVASDLNGELDAMAGAARWAREIDAADRRREELDAAAEALRETRRYQALDSVLRLGRRRPQDESA